MRFKLSLKKKDDTWNPLSHLISSNLDQPRVSLLFFQEKKREILQVTQSKIKKLNRYLLKKPNEKEKESDDLECVDYQIPLFVVVSIS